MVCESCGHKLPENSKFCSACGESAQIDSQSGASSVNGSEPEAHDNVITIETVDAATRSPDFDEAQTASSHASGATVQTAVRLEGVAAEEIEDLFFAISPASRRLKFRARYAVIPLLVIAVASLIIAAIVIYNTSYVGVVRSMLSLSRDFNERVSATPFAILTPLSECLTDGTVKAQIAYTDDYGDDFSLDLSLLSSSLNKSHLLRATADVYNTPLDLELYLNSERIALGSSIFGEDYYGVRFDTFSSDIRRFAAISGIEDIDFETLERYVSMLQAAAADDGGSSQYAADALFREFMAAHEPERTSDKISRNGKLMSAQVYTYSIEAHDIFVLLQSYIELLRSDEYMLGQLSRYFETATEFEGYGYYDPIFNGYYYVDSPSEAASAFLEDLWLTVDFIDSACEGTINIKLYSVKNRISVIESEIDIYIDGAPLGALLTLDFGLSSRDDWTLFGNLWDSRYEYSFGVSWQYEKNGDARENTLKLTYGDSFYSEQLAVSSVWNTSSGAFALTLRTTDGLDRQLRGNLTLGEKSFMLRLETAVQLSIDISCAPDAEIGSPDYINLNKWNAKILSEVEAALLDTYRSIYRFG